METYKDVKRFFKEAHPVKTRNIKELQTNGQIWYCMRSPTDEEIAMPIMDIFGTKEYIEYELINYANQCLVVANYRAGDYKRVHYYLKHKNGKGEFGLVVFGEDK